MKPKISLIVLNWNGQPWLKNCFTSIYQQDFKKFEVILADNNSTDNSIKYTKKYWPKVRIVSFKNNLGYVGANNLAAQKAQGKYLLFLNNDTKIQPNFLRSLSKEASSNKILTPQAFDYQGEKVFPKDKPFLGLGRFGYPVFSLHPFYADGSALFIAKQAFNNLGGFDEDYFIFHEDIDLCWRAQLVGFKITPVPEAKIYHAAGGTLEGSKIKTGQRHRTSTLRRFLTEKNALSNLLKNYGLISLILFLPIFLIIGWGEAFLYLLSGQPTASLAIIRAHWWNLTNLKKTLKKRARIQKTRRVDEKEMLKFFSKGSGKWSTFKKIGIPKVKKS
ncbi:MAG: glycosyltransferase family 2 protein [Patescibacteria group bacterium]|jgi:GT2 family glycosyltransferase